MIHINISKGLTCIWCQHQKFEFNMSSNVHYSISLPPRFDSISTYHHYLLHVIHRTNKYSPFPLLLSNPLSKNPEIYKKKKKKIQIWLIPMVKMMIHHFLDKVQVLLYLYETPLFMGKSSLTDSKFYYSFVNSINSVSSMHQRLYLVRRRCQMERKGYFRMKTLKP